MKSMLDKNRVRGHLKDTDLRSLFITELGWDHGGQDINVPVDKRSYFLTAVAQKRGMIVYQYLADSDYSIPDHTTRKTIEKAISKSVHEHIIVYISQNKKTQYWQWVKRRFGQSDEHRSHTYNQGQSGDALIQKLEHIVFTLEEESDLTIVDVSKRVSDAFDVEKVTKKFYDRFKEEHTKLLNFINGIKERSNRVWYTSLMLNRMMFVYFIQKQGFLDSDVNYLQNHLKNIQQIHGNGQFQTFYRLFLLRLFHEGFNQPVSDRAPELVKMLGNIPYLNGGLFEIHKIESSNINIHIPDVAFERIFDFFDAYQWHLDDRPLYNDNEINPDVIGYIFEKYINQRQMGAYYTKEDITGYISRNTIIPRLFDRVKTNFPSAFMPGNEFWLLLRENPDRYIHESIRHGITYDIHKKEDLVDKRRLPQNIAVGIENISQRIDWNRLAPQDYALPTETWREHIARRQHYHEIRTKIVSSKFESINDLITYNLDIGKFVQDVIARCGKPELILAFWKVIKKVSILDPTCGSGAFLFAALNVLEPIYTACMKAMRGFRDDQKGTECGQYSEYLAEFCIVLDSVATHANQQFFILKSIIVNNIYGVDIMEEAVEICKLRLFLKLIAQLDNNEQIEPLPDIDFNIRPGNALVGFSSMKEINWVLVNDMVKHLSLPEIEKRAQIAGGAYQEFCRMQTDNVNSADAFAIAKSNLQNGMDVLRGELDNFLATEYGVETSDKQAFRLWLDSHKPFHWFVEFYGVMHNGGFDVIIGNPPYVSLKKISYRILPHVAERFPNIYGQILSRSLALAISNGRIGMIVPLSITFSRDFKTLRKKLFDWGAGWFSSFDNIPAALFAGVSQRCTIWIGCNSATKLYVGPMHRWCVSYRSHLFPKLTYFPIDDLSFCKQRIPKLTGPGFRFSFAFNHIAKSKRYRSVVQDTGQGRAALSFSQSARNFISVFRDAPPCLDEASLAMVSPSKIGHIILANDEDTYAALAAASGEFFFWYWLVLGDGFDVTSWIIKDYLAILDFIPPIQYKILVELGCMLHVNRNSYLVFKKNAQRYVGNFNYRGAFQITRRVDLLILDSLNVSREDALDILGYVQRVLSINKYAGEKGIPTAVRSLFPVNQQDTYKGVGLYTKIDSFLMSKFSFSDQEISYVVDRDVNFAVH